MGPVSVQEQDGDGIDVQTLPERPQIVLDQTQLSVLCQLTIPK
jgi:hypothetical protein